MNQEAKKKKLMLVCSRDSLDGAYPSAVLAINAVRIGMDAAIYYTFSGLNVIRQGFAAKLKFYPSGPLGAIPGMAQLATGMMKKKIEKAELPTLEDLLEMCQLEGVKLFGVPHGHEHVRVGVPGFCPRSGCGQCCRFPENGPGG